MIDLNQTALQYGMRVEAAAAGFDLIHIATGARRHYESMNEVALFMAAALAGSVEARCKAADEELDAGLARIGSRP